MRWLVVGHGRIVPNFVAAARGVGHEVVAVAGRNSSRVSAFAASNRIGEATVEATSLAGRVDAAYVATPHSGHRDAAVALLRAGVPVLCEKPMAINARQVSEMVTAARDADTFLMEAMWTRHLPVQERIRTWIDRGLIGAPKLVEAALGFSIPYEPESRIWSAELGGGSLLDLGIYTLTMADLVFDGPPDSFSALAELSPEAVDAHLSLELAYSDGGMAHLSSAINTRLPTEARIAGESGTIIVPAFWSAERAFLNSQSERDKVRSRHRINGFEYQILEVARCLRAGLTESPVVPWDWSLRMVGLMDAIRAEVGVRYPADEAVG